MSKHAAGITTKWDHPSLAGKLDAAPLMTGDWFVYTSGSASNRAFAWSDDLYGEDGGGSADYAKRRVGRHVKGVVYATCI